MTELEYYSDVQIKIKWKTDDTWRGVIHEIFDFATVEVKWQDGSNNIVDLKDLILAKPHEFVGKKVKWSEDTSIIGKISAVFSNKKNSGNGKKSTSAEPALVDYSRSAPRVQVTWQEDSDSSENETNGRIESEESDVPPSESEDDLPLEAYKTNGSRRTLKSNTTQSKEFLQFYHGERTIQNPIDYSRKYFTHDFLNTLCEKANLYRAAKDINTTFTVNKKDMEIYIGITIYMTLIKTGSTRRYWAAGTR